LSSPRDLPILKEARLAMLIKNADCIDRFPFDRDRQRTCVMSLYENKSEKSVFRGMVIPTLRTLGWIVGFGDAIRLSSNAKLLLSGEKKEEANRIARAVFLELDDKIFRIIPGLRGLIGEKLNRTRSEKESEVGVSKEVFINAESVRILGPSKRQKRERISKWLSLLMDCQLLKEDGDWISINERNLSDARMDLEVAPKRPLFLKTLLDEYRRLPTQESAGIVDIVVIREKVASNYYDKRSMVLSEAQFDELLRNTPLVSDEYVISLGQPMGAEEKLFSLKGNYYRTIAITIYDKKVTT
jgi:hypothetical protein